MEEKNIISIRQLSKTFGNKKVLDSVDLDIERGRSFVVLGGSGQGKSVFMRCILGLETPDHGSKITIDGHDLSFVHIKDRPNSLKIGVLFQGNALFDSMKIWQNIAFGPLRNKSITTKREAIELSLSKLSLVGLESDVANLYPIEISGGMQKRVALARAIADEPDILFFDEPTSGLDPMTSSAISNLIKKCTSAVGVSAFTITHDMRSACHIGDSIAMLHEGKLIWEGDRGNLLTSGNKYVDMFVNGKISEL